MNNLDDRKVDKRIIINKVYDEQGSTYTIMTECISFSCRRSMVPCKVVIFLRCHFKI